MLRQWFGKSSPTGAHQPGKKYKVKKSDPQYFHESLKKNTM